MDAKETAPPDFCEWCKDTASSGRLVAVPKDEDPVPTKKQQPTGDGWRLCYKCGWHFHGGHGESGDYRFAPDAVSELERALMEEDGDDYEEYEDGP